MGSRLKTVWEDNLKLFPQTHLDYPDENLVRLLSGRYIEVSPPPARVLDHGFGHGNNLKHLVSKGYECVGCEISEALVNRARDLFPDTKFYQTADPPLPFEDAYFDMVVSWNVIHYFGTHKRAKKMAGEYLRLLKPGGLLLLSTLAPLSSLMARTEKIQTFEYQITRASEYDNRQGLKLFAAKKESSLLMLFGNFSKVRIGRVTTDLFNKERKGDWFIVYAVK